jgi:TRAP-type mannitol/chloroaromatic compound transport system permease small subunit
MIDRLNDWQGRLFSWLIVLVTLQVCYELTLRYVFNSPTYWGLELSIYLCGITYVMAGAYAERHGAHIRMDILYLSLSPKRRALLDLLVTAPAFFFFCGVLIWQSGMWAWESMARGLGSGTQWNPPIWPMRASVVVGSVLLFLQGVAKLVRDLNRVIGKGEE